MRHTLVMLLTAGALASGNAVAESVSIPCDEFVQATGKRLACDKMPVIRMSAEKWEKEKAVAKARASSDADAAPWDRKGTAKSKANEKIIGGCDLPPWERPEGLKCD